MGCLQPLSYSYGHFPSRPSRKYELTFYLPSSLESNISKIADAANVMTFDPHSACTIIILTYTANLYGDELRVASLALPISVFFHL